METQGQFALIPEPHCCIAEVNINQFVIRASLMQLHRLACKKIYYISSGTQGRGSESGWDKWQPNKTCVMALILTSFTLIHTNCPWVSDDVFEQDCTSQLVAQAAQAKKTRKSNGAGTLRITCIKVWESNRFVLKARNLTNFSITLRVSQFY